MIIPENPLRTLALSVFTLALADSVPLLGGTYTVKDLGTLTDLAGRNESRPNGIANDGKIAAVNAAGNAYRSLLYNGSWTDLGTLGGSESLAAGVDNSGRVVGYSKRPDDSIHAYLWTPGGTDGVTGNPQMKDLGTLGGANSQGQAVSGSGLITGYSDVPSQNNVRQHAFVYANGKMTDIGKDIAGLPNSFGYGINNSGHVVGAAYNAAYANPHGFYHDGSKAIDIGGLGGEGCTALAINESDHITGYATTSDGFDHAFRYVNGTMTDLGTLGGNYSYGLGINKDGVIVGGSFVDNKDSTYHAFIWSNNSMQDLNGQLDASGTGWTLIEARAINDAGQVVGIGALGGSTRGFLLTPKTSIAEPRFTGISVRGRDVVLSFQSVNQALYSMTASPILTTGNWTNVMTNIRGNGGIMTVTNTGGASLPYRFYRVKTSP